jgi:hypothetical protein
LTVFFKNLKFLAAFFFFLTIFFVPAMVINYYGAGLQDPPAPVQFSAIMLGNIASANSTGFINIPLAGTISKSDAGLLYSVLDVFASIAFVAGFLWVQHFERVEDHRVDKNTLTADDYSVYIPWVPRGTTEEDIEETIMRAFHVDSYEYDSTYERGGRSTSRHQSRTKSSKNESDHVPYHPEIAEIHIVQDHMAIINHYVQRGAIFREIERINDKILRYENRIETGDSGFCGRFKSIVVSLKLHRKRLEGEADFISKQASMDAKEGAVCAFVTFQRQEDAEFYQSRYPTSVGAICCMREALKLRGHTIRVEIAPPPSSVLWANLNIGSTSQTCRQFFTFVLTLVFLLMSFVLLYFASLEQQKLAKERETADCASPSMMNLISTGVLNATSVASLPNNDPSLYCWCSAQSWRAKNTSSIAQLPNFGKCTDFACPALYLKLTAGSTPISELKNYSECQSWAINQVTAIVLVVLASFIVVVVNYLLATFMRHLTFLEGHHSYNALNASYALRLFFAQFFNTGVLTVIINASVTGVKYLTTTLGVYSTGKYDDFSPAWYTNVGGQIVTTMLINIVSPHIYVLVMRWLYKRSIDEEHQEKLVATAKSQRDLNEVFIGPFNDYPLRYAQIYNTITVCFIFSTGIPILIPIACVSFAVSFLVDKLLFVDYYRISPSWDIELSKTMNNLLPAIIVAKLALGTWMLSNVQIFKNATDPLGLAIYSNMASRLLVAFPPEEYTKSANRVTQSQALPVLIFLIIMVTIMLLRFLFISIATFLNGVMHVVTCGMYEVTRELDTDHSSDPEYREAVDPANTNPNRRMVGIQSYNILANPEIQAAFAIPPEFSKHHKCLTDVALYKVMSKRKSMVSNASNASNSSYLTEGAATEKSDETSERSPVKVRVHDNGEIHVEDENAMHAYFNNEYFGADAVEVEEEEGEEEGDAAINSSANGNNREEDEDALYEDDIPDNEHAAHLSGIPPMFVQSASRHRAVPDLHPHEEEKMSNSMSSIVRATTTAPVSRKRFIIAGSMPNPPPPPPSGPRPVSNLSSQPASITLTTAPPPPPPQPPNPIPPSPSRPVSMTVSATSPPPPPASSRPVSISSSKSSRPASDTLSFMPPPPPSPIIKQVRKDNEDEAVEI